MARADRRRLYLVRHGLPDYRGGKREDEVPGPVLSSLGEVQAGQTADFMAALPLERIYTSPLARTRRTAEIVHARHACPLVVAMLLKEWQRAESFFAVNSRAGLWLRRWLERGERCAALVSHGSPLVALLRQALYLPHFHWWSQRDRTRLQVATVDRFTFSMASVVELSFDARDVTARTVFDPEPRIMQQVRRGVYLPNIPRPTMVGEVRALRRRNFAQLLGYRTDESRPLAVRLDGA